MQANPDFKDLFRMFNEEKVEYLVIGAHAVIFYARPRFTKDLDIWVNPTPENAARVYRALQEFGAPLIDITVDFFTDRNMVYQIGVVPNRIDIVMAIDGAEFPASWSNKSGSTYDGIPINILGRDDLIKNKRTSGRPQDLQDLEHLQ